MMTTPAIATPMPVTSALARTASALRFEDISGAAVTVAKHCMLDWAAVTLRGLDEPLVPIMVEQVLAEGGSGVSTLIGRAERVSPRQAALVNGCASHALDYDDVNLRMIGHPTVAIFPALFALAESRGSSGKDLLTAFVAGYETACLVGALVLPSHYARGFHSTGTVGTFGAAAACAHLLKLGPRETATALGIAGTQAAGLKAMFGTMCKPLHAGKASESGLLAAQLAARGFTSRTDVIECGQGFAQAQSDGLNHDVVLEVMSSPSFGRYNLPDTLFKYHASCYQTHSAIEVLNTLRASYRFEAADVARVAVRIDAGADTVCNIREPSTGLETKFSLRMLAAYALMGVATADIESFTDERARDPALVALRDKVEVEFAQGWPLTRTGVTVHLIDGRVLLQEHDSGTPATDLPLQALRLREKMNALAGGHLGPAGTDRLCELLLRVEELSGLQEIASLLGPARH